MTTATRKVKPERLLTVNRPLSDGWLLLQIDQGVERDHYIIDVLSSDWGRAFRYKNAADGVPYNVMVGEDGHDSCECKGFLRWGTQCKHIGSARKLIELQQV